jgi:hypothetical protein
MAFHLRLPRLFEPGEMCITHRDEMAAPSPSWWR